MSVPVRLQRKRVVGFDLQAASQRANGLSCVAVTRPNQFSNHYIVWLDDDRQWTVSCGGCHWTPEENTKRSAQAKAIELYRADVVTEGPQNYRLGNPVPTHSDIVKGLRGQNLACWCALCDAHQAGKPLGVECAACMPCHVDVLLPIANAPLNDRSAA